MTETSAARFWAKVHKIEGGCWEWRGKLTKAGYGQFGHALRVQYAHRLSFEMAFGPIPQGLYICHKCDNRKCINPAHLFSGTHKDNFADQVAKGRQCYGMKNGMSVLTNDEVFKIRAIHALGGIPCSSIGRMFGVSAQCAHDVVQGRRWSLVR